MSLAPFLEFKISATEASLSKILFILASYSFSANLACKATRGFKFKDGNLPPNPPDALPRLGVSTCNCEPISTGYILFGIVIVL